MNLGRILLMEAAVALFLPYDRRDFLPVRSGSKFLCPGRQEMVLWNFDSGVFADALHSLVVSLEKMEIVPNKIANDALRKKTSMLH